MSGEGQLLLIIAGVHLLGLGCVAVLMVFALSQGSGETRGRTDRGSDDGWGGNEPRRPSGPFDRPWGGVPLPDAKPAPVRLRDERKLPDLRPRPKRRPAREPDRTPTPLPR